MLSEQDCQEHREDLRRSVRAVVGFRIIVADKAGLANGQMIDMTRRGVDYASRNLSGLGNT